MLRRQPSLVLAVHSALTLADSNPRLTQHLPRNPPRRIVHQNRPAGEDALRWAPSTPATACWPWVLRGVASAGKRPLRSAFYRN